MKMTEEYFLVNKCYLSAFRTVLIIILLKINIIHLIRNAIFYFL